MHDYDGRSVHRDRVSATRHDRVDTRQLTGLRVARPRMPGNKTRACGATKTTASVINLSPPCRNQVADSRVPSFNTVWHHPSIVPCSIYSSSTAATGHPPHLVLLAVDSVALSGREPVERLHGVEKSFPVLVGQLTDLSPHVLESRERSEQQAVVWRPPVTRHPAQVDK